MKTKKLLSAIACLLLTFLILYLIPIKREINESFLCQVLDQEDESYSDQVTVTFQGTYTDYLFRKDLFTGRIDIAGYNFISPKATNIEITVGDYEYSHIVEFVPEYSIFRGRGSFHGEEDFESFFLWLNVPDEDNTNSAHSRYFLTYPSMALKEVYEILGGK